MSSSENDNLKELVPGLIENTIPLVEELIRICEKVIPVLDEMDEPGKNMGFFNEQLLLAQDAWDDFVETRNFVGNHPLYKTYRDERTKRMGPEGEVTR